MLNLIPKPTFIQEGAGEFTLSHLNEIQANSSHGEIQALIHYFYDQVQALSGLQRLRSDDEQSSEAIVLLLDPDPSLSEEGYELSISTQGIRMRARHPAGLFYAIQTFLQLLPAQPTGAVSLPAVVIRDTPRFAWRGAMLDVARHFFGVEDVKRFIDLIAHYKINRLHLHLTDDQGWRIEIKSWPRLTDVGGSTQVGGGRGGYYTQAQYKKIVDYARSRYIVIVPEIDTPGHTNAALASYAELNESEEAPALYIDTKVGFSTLWINAEVTYKFLNDVIGELSALTPGPYIHIGGDEARSTPKEQYRVFIRRIQEIVTSHGKTAIGWNEIGEADLLPGTIAQVWDGKGYEEAARQGAKFILSPSKKIYLDMKYDASSPLGLNWAGLIDVKESYDWEPDSYLPLLEEKDILGLEAPLWTETILTMNDIGYMVFPRLLGIAELAWSPKSRCWDEYRKRLAAHGNRMEALGINYYKSPDVEWK
ncbi:MAG TPA: beta-N-acetylhexosaminidase [Anaerolineales bacterium]|nr:beta-N-acetylhexosaminidase [Anaerolineales bacterium]